MNRAFEISSHRVHFPERADEVEGLHLKPWVAKDGFVELLSKRDELFIADQLWSDILYCRIESLERLLYLEYFVFQH